MENEINYSPRQLLECQVSSAGEELLFTTKVNTKPWMTQLHSYSH